MPPRARSAAALWKQLHAHAMAKPGAHEDHPWGEVVVKVNKKVFVFLGRPDQDGGVGLSVKLPETGAVALALPFAEPTGYGLGKSGWVTARFEKGEPVPVEMLEEWIDESYRAVAPKKLQQGAAAGKAGKEGSRRKKS